MLNLAHNDDRDHDHDDHDDHDQDDHDHDDGDLIPPEPVLVELSEAVDDNGDGQGEDEDAGKGAAASDQFPKEGLWVEVVANRCDGHKAPPWIGDYVFSRICSVRPK